VGAAALLLMPPRLRHRTGPALRGGPLPVTATLLSLLSHAALGVAVLYGASVWSARQPKTYVVNLVPAVAAVGSPQGHPALPPRAEEPPPRPAPRSPSELPERQAPRPAPAAPPPEMPARAPSLPDRALPERTLPPRAPGLPKPSEKELPAVASPTPPAPSPTTATGRAETPPSAPLGTATGSAQGSGAVTVNVSDFPFAYYLAAVQRKITERWEGRALQGRQPVAVFEIGRDGRLVGGVAIEKTSGNSYYDQIAQRAIIEAVPFPPLPAEFPAPTLRIHLGFNFAQDRG
jgi:outer membrane biosynthesis protein TonB